MRSKMAVISIRTSSRIRISRRAPAVCAVTLASLLLLPPAVAPVLERPARLALTRPRILKETPTQTKRVADQLTAGDDDNRIHVIADDLRARYPTI